jgi:penicillin-binding protein 1C
MIPYLPMKHLSRARRLSLFSAAAAGAAAAGLWLAGTPPVEDARRYPCGVILRDAGGRILRVGLGPSGQDCRPVYRASTNDWIVRAVVAAEDRRFFSHPGVDARALARAAWQNVTSLRRVSGASTLTMQTVRLIRPAKRRTLWRKAVEAVQALRLERCFTKEEILSQYLNRAPFGSNLVGIEAAAQGWFGKTPQELNLGEAALLAGMVQSPTRFRPDRRLNAALKRRAYVLDRMAALGLATAAQRADAERVPLALKRAPRPFLEPFFCDWAQRGLPPGDHRTALDPALQALARSVVERQARAHGCDAAVAVLAVSDGSVRAWHCTGDYFAANAGQVNTVLMPRPAGSTLKPFAYVLAMDRGLLTPARVLADVPRRFGNEQPMNFSGAFLGPVGAREALIRSLNLPAIEAVERAGLPRFHATLRELGFAALDKPAEHYGLGLALGNGSVRLLELACAYACLARGGVMLEASPCRSGARASSPAAVPARVFSEGACWLAADMLGGEERSRDAVGHVADARLPRFAWKTGTSSGFRDAWTVAWNPGWVVAVWCGYKSGRGGGETLVGKSVAAPAVWEIARRLPAAGWFARPEEVEPREVCAVSGCPAGALCGRRLPDWALRGRTLSAVCPVHLSDGAGGARERWPEEVADWLAERAAAGGADGPSVAAPLRIVSPADGTVYRLVDGLAAQEIVFTVSGAAGKGPLTWFCDDALAETAPVFRWKPDPGEHRFVCSTATGEAASVRITVESD